MKYIVLLSNGFFNHDFALYRTKELAEHAAERFREQYKAVVVAELTEDIVIDK